MVLHHFFCQLALFVLVWLFVMMHVTWSKPGLTTPPVPAKPKRNRSNEPKAFEGSTKKPHCALCEQETAHPQPPSPVPPDPMPPTNRRPRRVDTSMHFCPHTACNDRGWLGLNNLWANGHPSSGPWRQFHCTSCNGFFPEHHGTIFHGKQAAGAIFMGSLNLYQFACGQVVNPDFGPVRNAWNRDHIAGGSSSGSGTAVAADMCFGSLGRDTGGSVMPVHSSAAGTDSPVCGPIAEASTKLHDSEESARTPVRPHHGISLS